METYGDLKKTIKNIQLKQKGEKVGKVTIDVVLGAIPGLGAAKSTFDVLSAAFRKPDTKKSNSWLDKLDIDDEMEAIVDNTVENGFLKFLSKTFDAESDDKPLEQDFNMNAKMVDYLKKNYKQRTITGISEQKSVFDQFFTKFAYKFDKGYPDMNNDQDVLLLEKLVSKVVGEKFNLKEGAADIKARQELIDKNPGFFGTQSDSRRIANKNKISAEEFVTIVKDTFNIDNVIVHPPNSGPNKKPNTHSSSKFNMFEFEVDGKKYLFILSGGASANVGQQFEDKITLGLQGAMEGIEDEQIKQILSKLNINPKDITKVEQTGGIDTKRTINPEAGPQDRGKIISDVTVMANGKPYYLSIKNKTGDNIYNGGTVSSITYNKEDNKVEFDQSKYNSDKLKQSVFNMFDIDPIKVTNGLNDYIEDKGTEPSWQDVNIDKDEVMGFIGSAVDYGYYYVREEGNGVKVIHLESPEDVNKLIGKITYAKVKYPGKGVKSTYARVGLEDSEQGLRYIEVQIRNASGGIANPVIKVQTK